MRKSLFARLPFALCAEGELVRSPIMVWGRVAKEVSRKIIVVLNAKTSEFMGIPRFSVGDFGALVVFDGTPTEQMQDLMRRIHNEDGEQDSSTGHFELPEGLTPWNAPATVNGQDDDHDD